MVEKRLYRIIATLGAIFIYLFFAYTLVDFVKNNKTIIQDFGYNVEDAIVVEIAAPVHEKPVEKPVEKPKPKPTPEPKKVVEPIILPPDPEPIPEPKPVVKPIILPPEPEEKPKPKVEPVKETPPEPVQEKKESRDLIAKSARDLFSTVRTDNYDKAIEERRKQDAARASRLKKQKAEQARKKREAKKQQKARAAAVAAAKAAMQDIEQSTAASHKKSGTEDSFWSPVSSRIQALWNRTIQTQDGLNADVKITIDNRGRLSYRIKRLSNNSLFDQKLHIFLQNLEYESFPKYRGGSSTSRVILFEDQEGL
jgi:outer membrane biosynthesis protein TonB